MNTKAAVVSIAASVLLAACANSTPTTTTAAASTTTVAPSTTATTAATTTSVAPTTTTTTATTTTVAEESTVVGVVIAVEGNLEGVESFTLRLEDGTDIIFTPAEDAQFDHGPMSHIRDHLANGQPVRVDYLVTGGMNLALRAEDA